MSQCESKGMTWQEILAADFVDRICDELEEREGFENCDALWEAVNEAAGFDIDCAIEAALTAARAESERSSS